MFLSNTTNHLNPNHGICEHVEYGQNLSKFLNKFADANISEIRDNSSICGLTPRQLTQRLATEYYPVSFPVPIPVTALFKNSPVCSKLISSIVHRSPGTQLLTEDDPLGD